MIRCQARDPRAVREERPAEARRAVVVPRENKVRAHVLVVGRVLAEELLRGGGHILLLLKCGKWLWALGTRRQPVEMVAPAGVSM